MVVEKTMITKSTMDDKKYEGGGSEEDATMERNTFKKNHKTCNRQTNTLVMEKEENRKKTVKWRKKRTEEDEYK